MRIVSQILSQNLSQILRSLETIGAAGSQIACLRSLSDTTLSEIIVGARRPRSGITYDRISRSSMFFSSLGRSFPRVVTFQSLRF